MSKRIEAERHAPEKSITISESELLHFIADAKSEKGKAVEQDIDPRMTKEYLDELAFMSEEVDVRVAQTTDRNERPVVTVGVNGKMCNFPRGVLVRCPRYFVDALIVKGETISTPEVDVPGPNGPERARVINKNIALRYPFSIERDPNKKGHEWLRRRLNELV